MRAAATAGALLLALLLQTALGLLLPQQGRAFDPFLIVVVFCGLAYGETHGMLAGAAAGWIQDVLFGGGVAGLSALTKLLLGFGVGLAGTRLLLVGPAPRFTLLFAATLLDALAFERLARLFGVPTLEAPFTALMLRALGNALVGTLLYRLVERRLRLEAQA